MAKFTFTALTLLMSTLASLSTAYENNITGPRNPQHRFYLEAIHEGAHPDQAAALNTMVGKIFEHAFNYGAEQIDTKTLLAGPYKAEIDPAGTYNRRIYITALVPVHHRTETRCGSGGDCHWKSVLGLEYIGKMLNLEEGESDNGRINELENINMTPAMVQDAIDRCVAHRTNGHGDCVVPQ